MSSASIMEAILTKIKTVLSEAEEVLASAVSPETSEEVNRLLAEAMSAGWTEGLQTWLATAETDGKIGHYATIPGHLMNISWKAGRKVQWDGQQEQFTDDDLANALITKQYREPWKLKI